MQVLVQEYKALGVTNLHIDQQRIQRLVVVNALGAAAAS
jgi:hypothetical protein